MLRAFLAAVAILVVGDAGFLGILKLQDISGVFAYLIWAIPVIAAFAASMITPRRKFVVGLLVAVPAAILQGVANFAFEAMGNAVDFPGMKGSLLVIGMSFPWVAVLCTVGALGGTVLTKGKANA